MPKLRNGDTDVAMFTQWIARKCRNHNPLQELELAGSDRKKLPRMYKAKDTEGVKIVADGDQDTVIYMAAGRAFVINVREVAVEETEGLKTIAVGF